MMMMVMERVRKVKRKRKRNCERRNKESNKSNNENFIQSFQIQSISYSKRNYDVRQSCGKPGGAY